MHIISLDIFIFCSRIKPMYEFLFMRGKFLGGIRYEKINSSPYGTCTYVFYDSLRRRF